MAEKDWGDTDRYDIPEGEFCIYGTVNPFPPTPTPDLTPFLSLSLSYNLAVRYFPTP